MLESANQTPHLEAAAFPSWPVSISCHISYGEMLAQEGYSEIHISYRDVHAAMRELGYVNGDYVRNIHILAVPNPQIINFSHGMRSGVRTDPSISRSDMWIFTSPPSQTEIPANMDETDWVADTEIHGTIVHELQHILDQYDPELLEGEIQHNKQYEKKFFKDNKLILAKLVGGLATFMFCAQTKTLEALDQVTPRINWDGIVGIAGITYAMRQMLRLSEREHQNYIERYKESPMEKRARHKAASLAPSQHAVSFKRKRVN